MGQKAGMSFLIERIVFPVIIIVNRYIGGPRGDVLVIPVLIFAFLTSIILASLIVFILDLVLNRWLHRQKTP